MVPLDVDGPLPVLPAPAVRRGLRLAMGVTIAEAAAELKVAWRTYSLWEKGRRAPRKAAHTRLYYAQLYGWWVKQGQARA